MSDFAEALARAGGTEPREKVGEATIDLLVICALFGEDPSEVAKELRRNTPLARMVRKVVKFDITSAAKPRGRPRSDSLHRRDRYVALRLRQAGMTLEESYAVAAQIRAREGRVGLRGQPITADGIRSAVERLGLPDKLLLGDLFAGLVGESDELLETFCEGSKIEREKLLFEH